MKAILLNTIFCAFWIFIGHFFPTINLRFVFIVYPFLFILSAYFFKYNLTGFIVIPFCFMLILLNDYLFRLYGGGIHDDAGRGWCELVFYLTLLTTTIALIFVMLKCTTEVNQIQNIKELKSIQVISGIGFVLLLSVITLLFFRKYNIYI